MPGIGLSSSYLNRSLSSTRSMYQA
jgi:hypothetical protein